MTHMTKTVSTSKKPRKPEKQWQNTFWVDSATGQVRQSRQMLGAGVIPVEMTFLKPAP
ncbi:YjbF family lipoprotein [Escherichia coli]|uniref:YjbF family lipoprotein n=1 Tax=Escherichia coli TaxID=562 RepID=UPI0025A2617C|nr:YjbF family lipoprotein [Escherichia coli]